MDQDLWDAVQVRLKDRGDVPLPQAGRKLYGRAEASRESKHL